MILHHSNVLHERMCVRERPGSICIIMIQTVLPVEFIVRRVWGHKELCHLIKQKHGMHEYYHIKIGCIITHYHSYVVKQSKVKVTRIFFFFFL